MPLFDSLGTAQSVRLTKMNSVPTTEDLRYALGEAKKRVGKVIELPFEHPNNHQKFVVALVLIQGKTAPTWTFYRGDGPSAKLLWSRSAEDVLMVQNKIKIDSQYAGDTGTEVDTSSDSNTDRSSRSGAPQVGSQPIIMGGASSSSSRSMSLGSSSNPHQPQPFLSGAEQPPAGSFDSLPAPPTLAAFFPQNYPAALDAFLGPADAKTSHPAQIQPGSSPQLQSPAPAFPIPEPAALTAPPAAATAEPAPAAPEPTQAATIQQPRAKLPPPINLDKTLLNQVHNMLSEPTTGLLSYPAFIFFLFREFARYQRYGPPLAVVVFEIGMKMENEIVPLPPPAVAAIVENIRSVASPLDMICMIGGGEFAALLISRNGAGAMDFAADLQAAIRDSRLCIAIGAASIPETCTHPEVVVAAARQAKEMAKSSPIPYVLFPSQI